MSVAHAGHVPAGSSAAAWALTALLVLVPTVAYVRAVATRRAAGRRWPGRRTASLVLGLLVIATALSPPVGAWAHHDMRGHMVQHLLLGMFAPVAIVLAAPVTLVLWSLPVAGRRAAAVVLRSRFLHALAHPVTAGTASVGGLFLLYLTPLYTVTVASPLAHHAVNLHLFVAGYLFTWSVIGGPDPMPRRVGMGIRVAVLIVAGAAHGYLAKLLYANAAGLPPGVGHDVEAVRAAAQLMYYGGDLAGLLVATLLFATWYRRRFPRGRTSGHAHQRSSVRAREARRTQPVPISTGTRTSAPRPAGPGR